MKELLALFKQGTKSALWAALINTTLGIIKTIAYIITGNVAMFAEMMHSYGDAANQYFVFTGSALSKKAPTDRFPGGFGRLVNLVLLGAVLVVGILAYETIVEGIHHITHPVESGEWVWLNVGVLGTAFILEGIVLYKAMKEVMEHTEGEKVTGMRAVTESFKNVKYANPATKLVFLEDLVATGGALLAAVAILVSAYTPFHSATGYASVIIGLMLFGVVGRIFLDNAAGVLGAADEQMEEKISKLVLDDPLVKDIRKLDAIKEGDNIHIELKIEVDPEVTIAEIDDRRDKLEESIMKEKGVSDVIIEYDEDDNRDTWNSDPKKE